MTLPNYRDREPLTSCERHLYTVWHPPESSQASRLLLQPGGALAIIGMNLHAGRDRWHLHEYVPSTREIDLRRYPTSGTITDWTIAAGVETITWRVAACTMDTRVGRAALEDPMLQKNATSQLAVLSDETYAAGMARTEAALASAPITGKEVVFPVDISLAIVTGKVSGTRKVTT
jgi:hypothetical protein